MDESKTFYVGLCMAGAVSAGAYTAGVMDYLIEALDTWERRRHEPGVPNHRVVIPVIGGASAGGITAILSACAVQNPIPPVRELPAENSGVMENANKFYNTWVDLTSDDVFASMLSTGDIKNDKQIRSLFNGTFIEELAHRALSIDRNIRTARPYLDPNLRLFATLSNLRGYWYDLFFRTAYAEKSAYFIHRHNDYATFRLNTTQYMRDGWIPLDFYSGTGVDAARDAAMATGAFPLGLPARNIKRNALHVNDHPWLRDVFEKNPLPEGEYDSLHVDGGMINNEPFEKVRSVLNDITGQTDREHYNSFQRFKSTVLMIDPFPAVEPDYNPGNTMLAVAGGTLSALINQARVKPEALINALDEDCAGQFMIAPTRKVPQARGGTVKETGSRAIACGFFSGFGGFIHKEFRIHDFFLGRANCEKFLRDHFTVPEGSTNAVSAGYESLSPGQREAYYAHLPSGARSLPIIPVLTPRAPKYIPVFASGHDWPVQQKDAIERYRGKIKTRVESLILNLGNYNAFTWLALFAGSRIILRRKITGVIMDTIRSSMEEHQLLDNRSGR
jgi:predicted acylesterase/phospholipase RssA